LRIEVKDLTKHFQDTLVLDRINLEIREKEFLGLLGPSGSGKTTLLRILGGLEFPDSGLVEIDGRNAATLGFEERKIGFVFQQYALFNHLTVFENVAFGMRVRPRGKRPARREIAERVRELLDLVQLGGFEDRFPSRLSGGQRQRVALARTLAIDPQVLLLDEPFGALDAKVRVELRRHLRDIHDTTGLTTIFVTHDQEEALDLADRVAIMNRGIIEQIGAPAEIYEKPETPFVFDFLGRTNAFDCVIEHGKAQLGDKQIPAPGIPDGPGVAFVRPHDIVLARADAVARSRDARLPGVAMVRFMSQLGQRVSVELLYEKRLIEAETSREKLTELGLARGDRCIVSLRLPRIYPRREAERQTGISERTAARPRLRRRLRERLIGTTE
jgi:sulfate/thiosulfate transport system ATP-binding protein